MFAKATLPDQNRKSKSIEETSNDIETDSKVSEVKPQVWYTVAYNSKNYSFSGIKRVQTLVTDLPEDVIKTDFDLDASFANLPDEMRSHYRRGHWRHIQYGEGENKTEKVIYVKPTILQKDKLDETQIAQLEAIGCAEVEAASRQGFNNGGEMGDSSGFDGVSSGETAKVDASYTEAEADSELVPQCISVEMTEKDLAHMGLSVAKTIEDAYQDDYVEVLEVEAEEADNANTSDEKWDEPEVA